MSYATQQHMIDSFGEEEIIELTNLYDSNASVINTVALEKALSDAEDWINTKIQGRYTLPLSFIPKVLTRLCCTIARYFLDSIRRREDVRQDYEDAMALLDAIATGKASLGLDTNNAPILNPPSVRYVAGRSRFNHESLGGF